jgi:hypothetical protein
MPTSPDDWRGSLNWPLLFRLAESNQADFDAGTCSMKDVVEANDIVMAIWRIADGWGRMLVKGKRRLDSAPTPEGEEMRRIGSFTVVYVRSADEAIAIREDLGEATCH